MKQYLYQEDIKERGNKDIPFSEMNEFKQNKFNFVEEHLKPTLVATKSGWNDLEYKLMTTDSGCETEFIVIWSGERGNSGSRWINVSGDSLAAIMKELCDNIW